MKACILARAGDIIRTTPLRIIDIVDIIRAGNYQRVYVQSEIRLGRVLSEMIT